MWDPWSLAFPSSPKFPRRTVLAIGLAHSGGPGSLSFPYWAQGHALFSGLENSIFSLTSRFSHWGWATLQIESLKSSLGLFPWHCIGTSTPWWLSLVLLTVPFLGSWSWPVLQAGCYLLTLFAACWGLGLLMAAVYAMALLRVLWRKKHFWRPVTCWKHPMRCLPWLWLKSIGVVIIPILQERKRRG